MTVRKFYRIAAAVLAAAVACGCGDTPKAVQLPKPVPAHGVVRFNGRPLAGARVTLSDATAGVSAYGVTDAEGKFSLTTYAPDDGAPPGKYQVAVSKAELTGHPTEKTAPPLFRPGGGAPHPHSLIPSKYANIATSGLTAEVSESGANDIVLDLKGSS